MNLNNKNVIITGAAGGIGSAIVKKLLNLGAVVGVIDKDKNRLNLLEKSLTKLQKKKTIFFNVDVGKFDQVKSVVNKFFNKQKSIHALINNAAELIDGPLIGFSKGKLDKYSIEKWNKTLSSNLNGHFFVTREVVEKMTSSFTRGVVINISSISAAGNRGQTAYSASKGALISAAKSMAIELAAKKVRVNCIAPSLTESEMTKSMLSNQNLKKAIESMHPIPKIGQAEDHAKLASFLLGQSNNWITGQVFHVDGGRSSLRKKD